MNNPVGLYIRLFCLTLLTFLFSCGGESDKRLETISATVSEDPEGAMESLRTIDKDSLSVADRHFYDLLAIKAADKAYVTHTSDSLILDVIGYYSAHPLKDRYAEALYYGGRVYSDLGDYPTALGYFQKSLDRIESDGLEGTALYGNVLSQTARLLDRMHLYDEAVPYIEKVIELEREEKDTLNLVYDLQLLGGIHLRNSNYSNSRKAIEEALKHGKALDKAVNAKSKMYRAALFLYEDKIDSALHAIRGIPETVKGNVRNHALAYASQIYLKAGSMDTAFMYANEIIGHDYTNNKRIGYEMLLDTPLRQFLSSDSVSILLDEYLHLLDDIYNENQAMMTIEQSSIYNYNLHAQKRIEAERKFHDFLWLATGVTFLIMAGIIIALQRRIRSKNQIIQINKAIEKINHDLASIKNNTQESVHRSVTQENIQEIREHLRERLLALSEKVNPYTPEEITTSETLKSILEHIEQGKVIPEDSVIWIELEKVVLSCCPDFKENLKILSNDGLTRTEYTTALLVKCGISPSKIALLTGRTKSAIGSRRDSISEKIFGKKIGTKAIDNVIRLV